ncbi:exonuclease domain-containing protein [Cryobacterium sp. SO1]|uniref:exonuclease domain-containing protein n=1 Tax=Cryobacterium sp. SO1 TaxID=1897061 RepID=UPI0010F0EA28|nr:exonuclease domain-containing protein [Cryobacterium sp. SO1]RZI34458.1 DNA polymerase III PolC-type [Cryobacterium sp. SO1]
MQTSTAKTAIADIPSLCVFDLETTGVNTDEDRIVTCFIGRVMRDGTVNGSYSWLLNPGIPIPDGASAIHGITDEVAKRDGVDPATAIAEMLAVLRRSIEGGRPIVAYNASFDLSMLNSEARRYGLAPIEDFGPVLDPYVIDKAIDRYRRGKRTLVATAEYYGVLLEGAHDAEADAVATGRVAWALLAKTEETDLHSLHDRQVGWALEQAQSFQAYLRKSKGDDLIVIDGAWPIRVGADRASAVPVLIAPPA